MVSPERSLPFNRFSIRASAQSILIGEAVGVGYQRGVLPRILEGHESAVSG
jgi:hypothetical protein